MRQREVVAKSRGLLVASILAGSWRASPSPLNLSPEDLDEITPLLSGSGTEALAWRCVSNTELSTTAPAQLLHQAYRLQALQVAMRREKIEAIHRFLKEAGVDAILVKGWALAGFYPDPLLRPLGDIDLLVKPADYKTAREVLEKPETRGCWVDLHNRLTELADRSHDELFSRSQIVKLRETRIRVLSLEDHLALLTIHLLKHGGWRPLWLCDIAAIVESLPVDFDWNICLGSDKRRRSWISTVIGLANQLLGANLDRVPVRVRAKEVPAWLREGVLKQWGNLFPADHLPVQPRPLMSDVRSSPREILKETWERWPDSITATFNLKGRINNFPRWPYQLVAFSAQAGRYLIDCLRRIPVRT